MVCFFSERVQLQEKRKQLSQKETEKLSPLYLTNPEKAVDDVVWPLPQRNMDSLCFRSRVVKALQEAAARTQQVSGNGKQSVPWLSQIDGRLQQRLAFHILNIKM